MIADPDQGAVAVADELRDPPPMAALAGTLPTAVAFAGVRTVPDRCQPAWLAALEAIGPVPVTSTQTCQARLPRGRSRRSAAELARLQEGADPLAAEPRQVVPSADEVEHVRQSG
jgi:hypothetical protein